MSLQRIVMLDLGAPAQDDAAAVARDIASETGADLTQVAINVHQADASLLKPLRPPASGGSEPEYETTLNHVRASSWRNLARHIKHFDLVVAPAEDTEGSELDVLLDSAKTPILRVRRRPVQVKRILMLIDNSPECRRLPGRFLRIGLWPAARLVVLPMDRPSVAAYIDQQIALLRSGRPDVAALPPLDLNFERPELENLLTRFQAAAAAHLTHRVGAYFGAVRNDPFQIIAECLPLVLLPSTAVGQDAFEGSRVY